LLRHDFQLKRKTPNPLIVLFLPAGGYKIYYVTLLWAAAFLACLFAKSGAIATA